MEVIFSGFEVAQSCLFLLLLGYPMRQVIALFSALFLLDDMRRSICSLVRICCTTLEQVDALVLLQGAL